MAKINDYYKKKQIMEQLAQELQQLEDDKSLKEDLKFEDEVRDLVKKYDKSPSDIIPILGVLDPNLKELVDKVESGTRKQRKMVRYRNPHTGETVETRGGNHKTLKEWREQYGKEEVKKWAEN